MRATGNNLMNWGAKKQSPVSARFNLIATSKLPVVPLGVKIVDVSGLPHFTFQYFSTYGSSSSSVSSTTSGWWQAHPQMSPG